MRAKGFPSYAILNRPQVHTFLDSRFNYEFRNKFPVQLPKKTFYFYF